jgi:hypothetical protein
MLIILLLSRVLDISTSSSFILIQIGMVKPSLFLSKTSLFKSNLLDLIGLSFVLFVIFSSSSINCPSCANTFKATFLYIYSIWAFLEGWGAWNGRNEFRGLAHLSSSLAPWSH